MLIPIVDEFGCINSCAKIPNKITSCSINKGYVFGKYCSMAITYSVCGFSWKIKSEIWDSTLLSSVFLHRTKLNIDFINIEKYNWRDQTTSRMHLEQLKFEKYREGWINNLPKLWIYEKSCMRTGEWKIMWQKIISVIDTTFAVAKRKSEKKFRLSFCNCKSCVYNCDDLLSWICYSTNILFKFQTLIRSFTNFSA